MAYDNEQLPPEEVGRQLVELRARLDELERENAGLREAAAGRGEVCEARLLSFVENSFDVIFILDPEGNFNFVSPSWKTHFGYELSQTIGHPFPPFVHPDDIGPCFGYLSRVLETGQGGTSPPYRVVCADGSCKLFIANGTRFTDADGRLMFHGIGRDITEQQRTLDLLTASEAKFSTMFKTSPDAININRLEDGAFVEINEEFTALLGYGRDEVLGRTSPEIGVWACPESRERLVRELARRGSVKGLETVLRRKDGTLLTALVSSSIIEVNGAPCSFNITRNITQRKLAEEKLRESETRYRTLFDQATDGIFVADPQGNILQVNEALVRMHGYSGEEMLALNVRDLDVPESARLIEERMQRVLAGESLHFDSEHFHKDGHRFPVEVTARRIELDGRPYVLSFDRDITERVRSEKAQRSLERKLHQIEKAETIGVLATGIAHNFNNVLTGVVGFISYARKYLDPAHRSYDPLLRAERASLRAGGIVQQLLKFVKGSDPVRRAVSVRKLVEESLLLSTSGSKVATVLELPERLPPVFVEEGLICQAFNCICINAVQAMPEGGTLTVRVRRLGPRESRPPLLAAGEYLQVAFQDTGCGIAEKDRPHVFTPFFSTKAEVGTGLGLASAHSIIDKHGGEITFVSEAGKGTTFTVFLPVAAGIEPVETAPAPSGAAESRLEGATVLVLDDDPLIGQFAEEALEQLGYRVTVCTNGEQAVESYRQALEEENSFAVAILDLTIPGEMGGEEVARRILAFDAGARLIVSSGHSHHHLLHNYREFGFCAALAKPYTLDEIAEKVNAAVAG